MGRRRRQNSEPDEFEEFIHLLVQVAGAYPLVGCILSGVLLAVAAVLWRMGSYYPLFGALAGLVGVILLIAAGVGALVRRFRPDESRPTMRHFHAPPPMPPPIPLPLPSPLSQRLMPYQAKFDFVSKGERAFYDVLRHVVDGRYLILIKVRLADLLYLPSSAGYEWRNKANQKHVDFVLCGPADVRPRLVIELDDRSHERTDRVERDRFVDEALRCAGIPILHVPAAFAYDPQELSYRIESMIGR